MIPSPVQIPTLESPIVNPRLTGANGPRLPIVSPSQWNAYPTALASSDLVPGGTAAQQLQQLYVLLEEASAYADEYCYGASPYGPEPGFAARYMTEVQTVDLVNGQLKLYCRQNPVLAFEAFAFAIGGGSPVPIPQSTNLSAWIQKRTIVVPLAGSMSPVRASSNSGTIVPMVTEGSAVTSYYTYIGGFPHAGLAESVPAGATTLELVPNTTTGEVAGLTPNTNMRIVDPSNGESIQVVSAQGSTVTLAAPTKYAHTAPSLPDFIPVTAIPNSVQEAVINLASIPILNRGSLTLTLNTLHSPSGASSDNGHGQSILAFACDMLEPFRQLI